MSDIADILQQFDYAETITEEIASGGLTVTVAEASHKRNRTFGQAMLRVMMRDDIKTADDITEDIEIDVLCETLLKSWDMTRNGKPVPIEEASKIFKANRAGSLLFREIGEIAATSASFLNHPSKKSHPRNLPRGKSPQGPSPNVRPPSARARPQNPRPDRTASRTNKRPLDDPCL